MMLFDQPILTWLNALPEPERSRAIHNAFSNPYVDTLYARDMVRALQRAFSFRDSPEGEEYWDSIVAKYY